MSEVAWLRAFFGDFQAGVGWFIGLFDCFAIARLRVATSMDVCVGISEADRAGDVERLCGRFVHRANDGRVLDGVANDVDDTAICLTKVLTERDAAAIYAFAAVNVCGSLAPYGAYVTVEATSGGLAN